MSDETINQAEISLPRGVHFDEVRARPRMAAAPVTVPELGPLADFVGKWRGSGFNTIFRPNNPITPTPLPNPVEPPAPVNNNVLELNLRSESLVFSPSVGNFVSILQAKARLSSVEH